MSRVDDAVGVEPLLHRTVVGRDEDRDPGFTRLVNDAAHREIDRFHGTDHGGFVFDVADDIHVGEVRQDKIVPAFPDLADRGIGHFAHGHLRGLIEELYVLSRRHDDAVLAGEGVLSLAAQEIGHVKGLFGFGDLHLADAAAGEDLAQGVFQVLLGREGDFGPEVLRVLDHGGVVKAERPCVGKLVKIVFDEAPRDLHLALSADVVEDHHVARLDPSDGFPRRVGEHQGVERFVVLSAAVGITHRLGHGIGKECFHGILSFPYDSGKRLARGLERPISSAVPAHHTGKQARGQRDLFGCKGGVEVIKITRKSGICARYEEVGLGENPGRIIEGTGRGARQGGRGALCWRFPISRK